MLEFWTIKQVGKVLQVSARTIDRWIKEGKFPKSTVTIHKTRRWNSKLVEQFLLSGDKS